MLTINFQANVADTNSKEFIQGLITASINYCIVKSSQNHYKFNEELFSSSVAELLRVYLDTKEERELEALHAIQKIVYGLEFPQSKLL